MVINLDILLLENFIIDAFLLNIVTQIVKVKVKFKKIILSSAFGCIYLILVLFCESPLLSNLFSKVIAAFIMIWIVFGKTDFIFLIKGTIIFLLVSMLLAGICISFELKQFQITDAFDLSNYSYKYLIISTMTVYLILYRIFIYIKDRKAVTELIYDIEIVTKDYRKDIRAFLDTGNELREPVTNLPVILVQKSALSLDSIKNADYFSIPYTVVNGNTGNLKAFKPDSIFIIIDGKKINLEAVIALCDTKLSKLGDYEALLSRGIVY